MKENNNDVKEMNIDDFSRGCSEGGKMAGVWDQMFNNLFLNYLKDKKKWNVTIIRMVVHVIVVFELAFSTKCRILYPFRSFLNVKIVESLIYIKN